MSKLIDRTGEKRMMNCGLEATIIRCSGYNDIDVRFSNGEVVINRSYRDFRKERIAPPNYSQIKNDRTGETRMMKCGLMAEITVYRKYKDIDIRFEDGQEVHHKQYVQFKKGYIAPPSDPRKTSRLGESKTMKCGMKAVIISYVSSADIDVRFEDGQIVEHRKYGEFKKGSIAPPIDLRFSSRIGEKRMMNCGLPAEITVYRKYKDIDIRFEDGQISEHKRYHFFKKGNIAHPCFTSISGHSSTYKTFIIKYVDRSPVTNEPYYLCKCQKCGFEIIDTARNIIKLEHKCETQPTEEGEN